MIRGLAITAGSNPIFLASIGSDEPITFATRTVIKRVRLIVRDIATSTPSKSMSLKKFATARVSPQRIATLVSFQITLKISLNSISSSERPRIIVTED